MGWRGKKWAGSAVVAVGLSLPALARAPESVAGPTVDLRLPTAAATAGHAAKPPPVAAAPAPLPMPWPPPFDPLPGSDDDRREPTGPVTAAPHAPDRATDAGARPPSRDTAVYSAEAVEPSRVTTADADGPTGSSTPAVAERTLLPTPPESVPFTEEPLSPPGSVAPADPIESALPPGLGSVVDGIAPMTAYPSSLTPPLATAAPVDAAPVDAANIPEPVGLATVLVAVPLLLLGRQRPRACRVTYGVPAHA